MNHWTGAFAGAYRKGERAFEAGRPRTANPYDPDMASGNGCHITFARAFWKAWRQGWNDAQAAVVQRQDSGQHGSRE